MRRPISAGIVGVVGILLAASSATLAAAPSAAADMGGDGDWSSPLSIDADGRGNSSSPSVAMDANGNAFAVWMKEAVPGCSFENTSCPGQVWANRFRSFVGWGRPVVIGDWGASSDPSSISGPIAPRVAVGLAGNAVVTWQANGTIWADAFVADYGWDRARPLHRDSRGYGQYLPIAIDRFGGATVLSESNGSSVWANYFVPASGWQESVLLANNASLPQIAVDDTGGLVLAAWTPTGWEGCQRGNSIGARWFVPGRGWGALMSLEPCVDVFPGRMAAEVGADGAALVAWLGSVSGSNVTLWAGRLTPDRGWANVSALGPEVNALGGVSIALDGIGAATAVFCTTRWIAPGSVSTSFLWFCDNIATASFTVVSGWGPLRYVRQSESGPETIFDLGLAVDGYGRTTFVWTEMTYPGGQNLTAQVWASRLPHDNVTSPTQVSSAPVGRCWQYDPDYGPAQGGACAPDMAVNSAGNLVVVWKQVDGSRFAIYSSLYGVEAFVDVTPPILRLSGPSDGMSTSVSSVIVEGWTEPDATLVVNGIHVAVSSSGFFTVLVPLSEGLNTIAALATDVSGNQATASVHVTYTNPVYAWIALLLGLQVCSIVTILFLVVQHRRQRNESRKSNPPQSNQPTSITGAASEPRNEGQPRASPTSSVPMVRPSPDLWPEVSEESPVYLSAKERVVLHLFDYAKYADASEVPRELTQEGIADSAGFERRHFAQYVRPLIRDGLIEERVAHVEGGLQKRKVYGLTPEGWRRALGVRTRVQSVVVTVHDGSEVRVSTIEGLMTRGRRQRSFLGVVRGTIENGTGGGKK